MTGLRTHDTAHNQGLDLIVSICHTPSMSHPASVVALMFSSLHPALHLGGSFQVQHRVAPLQSTSSSLPMPLWICGR